MPSLDFPGLLKYGIIGLGCILAVLTYLLLWNEQKRDAPRDPILRSVYVFMAFALSLCVLGLLGRSSDASPPLPTDLLPPNHPINAIRPELKSIEEEAIYRSKMKWEMAFTEMVPNTNRARFRLSASFDILNAANKNIEYPYEPGFEVPGSFRKEKIRGQFSIKSADGLIDDVDPIVFERSKNEFSCSRKIHIPAGKSLWIGWETLDEIEVEIPYTDYLFCVNSTIDMEIRIKPGATDLLAAVTLQRSDKKLVADSSTPGLFVFKATGPFLPYQSAKYIIDHPSP